MIYGLFPKMISYSKLSIRLSINLKPDVPKLSLFPFSLHMHPYNKTAISFLFLFFDRPIKDIIHPASRVKFNPSFDRWVGIIGL